jgi:hypothetical protein
MFQSLELSWPLLGWSGLTAMVLSSWTLMALRQLGATRYLPRAYWSCALFGRTGDVALVLAGLVRIVALTAIFPIAYAAAFVWLGGAEALTGLAGGLIHGLLAGLLLPLAARRCRGANAPGIMGWNLGRLTPLVLLFVHAFYGTVLAYVYVTPLP